WQVSAATHVTIDGQPVSYSGSRPAPAGPATDTLIAANSYGAVQSVLTAKGGRSRGGGPLTRVALDPPTIKNFTIQPPSGSRGYTLQWQTIGAHLVTINGKRVGLSGVLAIGPPHPNQSYVLAADN